jgi:hypothetical protein
MPYGDFTARSVHFGDVSSPAPTRRAAWQSRTKTAVFFAFLFLLAAFAGERFSSSAQSTDFANLFCAARMVLDGHGRQLYHAEFQRQYQAHLIGGFGTLYAHPPFEALLLIFAAWLPLKNAYLFWFLMNLVFLIIAIRRLARDSLLIWDWKICFAASLIFVPLLLCFQQGQDSLLFLLLMIYGFTALRSDRPFSAGCWLGLGLCKFQIVLPLVLVLLFTQGRKNRRALLIAFSLVGLTLAGASIAVCGWSVFLDYPRFLVALQTSEVTPRAMADFRGLVSFFHEPDHSAWNIAAVLVLSLTALLRTLMLWKSAPNILPPCAEVIRAHFDFSFANTLLFALLASYYLNPHDLTFLLLPVVLILNFVVANKTAFSDSSRWLLLLLLGILFFPPVPLWALIVHAFCLFSLPTIILFLTKPPKWPTAE